MTQSWFCPFTLNIIYPSPFPNALHIERGPAFNGEFYKRIERIWSCPNSSHQQGIKDNESQMKCVTREDLPSHWLYHNLL